MKRIVILTAATLISIGSLVPTAADAVVPIDPTVMAARTPMHSIEKAGCYRLGETGYHWYRFCAGPWWLYPHHRVCRYRHHHHYCYYR